MSKASSAIKVSELNLSINIICAFLSQKEKLNKPKSKKEKTLIYLRI